MKIIDELERLARELQAKRDEIAPTLQRQQRWGFDTGYRLNQVEELLESMPDPQVVLALCDVVRAAKQMTASYGHHCQDKLCDICSLKKTITKLDSLSK